jgi:hypothetical protein
MFCNQCGHKNPENAKFCSACGAQIEGVEKQEEEASPFDLPPLDAAAEQAAKPEEPESSPVQLGQVDEQMLEDHITAKEFAELTHQTEASVIQRIKVGDYRGRVKNNVWYIHLEDNQLPQVPPKSSSSSDPKPQERTTPATDYAAELGYEVSEVIQKIRDGELNGRLLDGEWVVILGHYDPKASVAEARGSSQTSAEYQRDPYLGTNKDQGFFDKFIKGDYGLAKTYWLFGFLVGLVMNFIITFLEQVREDGMLMAVSLAYIAYFIMWTIAVTRAARKYQGPKVWRGLTYIVVALNWLGFIVAFLGEM